MVFEGGLWEVIRFTLGHEIRVFKKRKRETPLSLHVHAPWKGHVNTVVDSCLQARKRAFAKN